MNFSADAVELIKEFEGFSSVAYQCPSQMWTLGYGHTEGVRPGDTCTKEQGELWLIDDMEWADQAVIDYIRVDLPQECLDALVSFTFNVGAAALGDSTLIRRLNAGEPPVPVIQQELPRWVNGPDGPLPGLVRRREAEVDLARRSLETETEQPNDPIVRPASISLVDAAKYYSGLSHQAAAFEWLEGLLTDQEIDRFATMYRDDVGVPSVLDVPYYYQLDSVTPEAFRMCFSSTCSMAVEYLEPGSLSSKTGDDEYLERVNSFGDTTDAAAQVAAMKSYGIDCEFIMSGSFDLIDDQLSKGLPIPCGWLHKGSIFNPTGGGHWSLVVGTEGDKLVVHDPFGEADLVNGGYVSQAMTAGQFVRYSKKNFGRRWEVEGPGTGWMIRIF